MNPNWPKVTFAKKGKAELEKSFSAMLGSWADRAVWKTGVLFISELIRYTLNRLSQNLC